MRNTVLPFVVLAIAIAIYFAYVSPTYSGTIASTQAAIASDNQALTAAAAYSQKQNELAAERDQISPDNLSRLSNFLPASVNNVAIILDLDALASRSGLVLSGINVANGSTNASTNASAGPIAAGSALSSVDLTLSGTGTYAQLRAFLAGVEQSVRLLDVTALSVHGSNTGVYTYTFTIRLYWLP